LLTLGKELLLLFGLDLGSFLVLGVSRVFSLLECNSLDSLDLLLKSKFVSFLNHSDFFLLSGVADSPSLSHTTKLSL
jgi:hypothetical protein